MVEKAIRNGKEVIRYQDCGFLEKVWRNRWYLLVPVEAVIHWLHVNLFPDPEWDRPLVDGGMVPPGWLEEARKLSVQWDIALDLCDYRRNYWLTPEELDKILTGD